MLTWEKDMTNHREIELKRGVVHAVEAGEESKQPILFLHGWPQNWRAYERILELAGWEYHAIAIDLPGVGKSLFPDAPFVKDDIAVVIRETVEALGLSKPVIVGHDVGGQITYSYLHRYAEETSAGVIMDVVIPGIEPWEEVLRNPYLWHFAFHSIPDLPEALVSGKQSAYFEFFYHAIAAHPERISSEAKEDYIGAYREEGALSTGFNWYRGFAEDARRNGALAEANAKVMVPVLYLRGERSGGDLDAYAAGLTDGGLVNLRTERIDDTGHFITEEQPDAVWDTIRRFIVEFV
jgi:pimeloyl-ACP methyl ester carboxylesterase